MSRETEMSIAVSELYPGFRFSPTDVELICYYLRRKIAGEERSVAVIPEVDIYNYEPWDLPDKSILKSEGEWFFFCARGRRYPHGSQSRRATGLGYWKATGKERNVKMGTQVVGTKRTLVFHIGRAPRGDRTEWIMHEYCLIGAPPEALVVCRLRKNCDFRANNNSGKKQMQDADCDDHSNMSNDCFHHTDGGASEGENKNTDSFSASASEWKLWNDTNAESSNNANDHIDEEDCEDCDEEDDDDCYAEILKDDIVELDETTKPTSKPSKASQALKSNLTRQKTLYTDASSSGCNESSKCGSETEWNGMTRCLLSFRDHNIDCWRFQDFGRKKNFDGWRLKGVFWAVALFLVLMISVVWAAFSG